MRKTRQTKIIAELGLGHDGSLLDAHGLIRACARAGADAVKLQCHIADIESTPHEAIREGLTLPADRTRQDYWRRTAFDQAGWRQLRDWAHECGVEIGASVFCSAGVAMLRDVVDFWKIPAGEWSNDHILEALEMDAPTAPVYLSLGMSGRVPDYSPGRLAERIIPMHCVSEYPARPARMRLTQVNERVGLSDHSGTIWPGLIAAWRHAPAIEVHVTWSHWQMTPDAPASLTIERLVELVEGVRWIEQLGRNPVTQLERGQAQLRYMSGRRVA